MGQPWILKALRTSPAVPTVVARLIRPMAHRVMITGLVRVFFVSFWFVSFLVSTGNRIAEGFLSREAPYFICTCYYGVLTERDREKDTVRGILPFICRRVSSLTGLLYITGLSFIWRISYAILVERTFRVHYSSVCPSTPYYYQHTTYTYVLSGVYAVDGSAISEAETDTESFFSSICGRGSGQCDSLEPFPQHKKSKSHRNMASTYDNVPVGKSAQ